MPARLEPFDVVNPSTSEVCGQAPRFDAAACDRVVGAAQLAFAGWARDSAARAHALRAAAGVVRAHAKELGELLSTELGRPLSAAIEEANITAVLLDVHASMDLAAEVMATSPSRVELHRRPFGVVAAIAPWNWPLGLGMWKVAPALRAGNTVILKPSPYTPLSSLRLGELLAEVLPTGVFAVASGGDETGEALVGDTRVAKIAFTGSVPSGRRIAALAAARIKRLTLELGGNDAAIVLADADIDRIVEPLFWAAFANSGQICAAVKRVYVAAEVAPRLVEALVEKARAVTVGDPFAADTELGPIGNRRQLERVVGMVEGAVAKGASVLCGGRMDGPGYYFAPMIVTGVSEGVALVDDEQFGPVLPILPFTEVDEAIDRANSTIYGLGGSVWTSDVERGMALAMRLDCGTAWVNQHFAIHPSAPFGGHKQSGLGYEGGLQGFHEYTQLQVLNAAVTS